MKNKIKNGSWFSKIKWKTIGDSYPLLNINDILDSLELAKYFSVFDLATGFHHIKMDPEDSHKTAFRYPRSNMSYPTKFEKLTFFEKWVNNNVLQLILKSWESNCSFNIFK